MQTLLNDNNIVNTCVRIQAHQTRQQLLYTERVLNLDLNPLNIYNIIIKTKQVAIIFNVLTSQVYAYYLHKSNYYIKIITSFGIIKRRIYIH